MGSILSLADRLLARGRGYLQAGLYPQAIRTLRAALKLDLSLAQAVDAHRRLAAAHEALGQFLKARRHLYLALGLAPRSAQLHRHLAFLLESDETNGDRLKAARHYARAVKLDHGDSTLRRDFALCLASLGRKRTGLAQLRKAHALNPDDLDTLRALALQLVDMDREVEARRLLRAAAFRQNGAPAYQQVQRLVGFAIARRQQEASRRAVRLASHEPPRILPFLAPVRAAVGRLPRGTILRLDGPQTSGPHVPRPARFRNHQTN
jgi:tetratricopeptide (TPR) repeat protein